MPLDARGCSFDDEPTDGVLRRLLRDPKFKAAVVEVLEHEVAQAGLTSPIDPAAFGRLLARSHVQQQLWGIAGAVMLRGQ